MSVTRFGDVILLAFSIVLLSMECLPGSYGRAVPHHRRRGEGVGRLQNVTLDRATMSTMSQLGDELLLDGCRIEHFGPSLFGLLQRTDCLTLRGGLIPTVTFHSHTLDTLVIEETGLTGFDVQPSDVPYSKLRVLQITRNTLEQLTPGIIHLVGLRRLDLSQNRLSYVNLGMLHPLARLRDLDLSVNRIVRLDVAADLRLPGLRNLWVSYNRLRTFEGFPGAFPALDTVRLIGNVWRCAWVDRARADIIRHGITAFGADYDCSGERQGGLCCHDDAPSEEVQHSTAGDDGSATDKTLSVGDFSLQPANRTHAPVGVRYGDVEIFL